MSDPSPDDDNPDNLNLVVCDVCGHEVERYLITFLDKTPLGSNEWGERIIKVACCACFCDNLGRCSLCGKPYIWNDHDETDLCSDCKIEEPAEEDN